MLRPLALLCFLSLVWLPVNAGPFEQGVAAFEKENYAEAAKQFRALAKQGHARAQVYLGYMYYNGQGVAESNDQAFALFQQAANQGDAQGQYELAQMYIFGFGIPPEETNPDQKAIVLYTKAADQGHADAQYELGFLYITGKGVEPDQQKGMEWIRKAAEQGHAKAKDFIGEY